MSVPPILGQLAPTNPPPTLKMYNKIHCHNFGITHPGPHTIDYRTSSCSIIYALTFQCIFLGGRVLGN